MHHRPTTGQDRPLPSPRAGLLSPTAVALGSIIVLLVVVEVVSFVHSRQRHAELDRIIRLSEHSTYVLGDLGHRLSRMQANVLEALTEPPETIGTYIERIDDIERVLHERIAAIPDLLSAPELEVWRTAEPELEVVVREIREALGEIASGRTFEAEIRLDDLAPSIRQLFDVLRFALELNQEERVSTLTDARLLLARARWLQLSLGLLLTAAIAGIAWRTLHILRGREHELDRHTARIERANRDLEAFAGRVAHDLRNVLAPLPACAHILEHAYGDADVVRETGSRIGRVGHRAGDLISGLLAFARSGEPPRGALASVRDEVDAVLDELRPQILRMGARVEAEVDPGLHAACDAPLLHVLLLNLVSNAVKFLEGCERRDVAIRCRAQGERLILEVEDTGSGIHPSLLERVFEPFFRAPGVRADGHGIGLATVSRIVEAHGGEIRVSSTEGARSTFRIVLPAARPSPGSGVSAEVAPLRSSS